MTQSEQSTVSSDTIPEAGRQEARSVGTSVDIEIVARTNIADAVKNECAKTKRKEMAILPIVLQ